MYRRALLSLLITCCLASTAAWAQEWTRFRGPNGAGQSDATTIPAAWGDEGYLWKVELPGIGHSSPVLWDTRIFLTSADPANGTRHVLCLSATDGKLLWKRDFASQTHRVHQQNSLASSTPTVDAERVYCAWATPDAFTLAALDHDGRDVWRIELGPFASQHGFGTSPILVDGLVVITNDQDADSFLVAVDAATGKIRWQVPRKVHDQQSASYATGCVYRPATGPAELIICSWAHGITSVDPRSGRTNWEAGVLERRPVGSPILFEGLILANCGEGSGNNSVVALRPPVGSDSQPEVVYKLDKTSAPYVPTLIAAGKLVFLWGDRGIVTAIDGATGHVHWRERVGGSYSGSPVRVAERIYAISATGEVVALAASDKFEVVGRSQLGEPSRSTPAIALDRMFLRSESHLTAVGR
ncbi:MAG TPA: PQQ-binding-like beta-propeller repeat protein [Pirellulales bacterium]|nr:PQQ-binding-like beta-propeller repeat protein [Pirellulales bacterium]